MKSITIDQFQEDFDAIIDKVENGQSFLIKSEHGDAMLVPYSQYKEADDLIRIHTELNNEAP